MKERWLKMIELSGIPVYKSIEIAPVFLYREAEIVIERFEIKEEEVANELQRYEEVHNKALDELNASMYIDAKGSNDKQTLESKYFANLQEAVNKPLYSKSLAELEEVQKKHKAI